MKVLFAVSNEEVSEAIVKRYQKEYKEIISYKNVYYFNAIIKELQKDKSYDRIVISEDLEAFSNTQYAQIDKFIFDKLDRISDEAVNQKGNNIPILLIASDRRQKSESMLNKLFGIRIYDVLLGNDRSFGQVCQLLNKPRTKKEAKDYYKIESEDVTYQSEDENDVSEVEIQNILAHYKRLGKDEKKYVESFNNIASQYNDVQLRLISKFLPLNVRAVLEEQSPKYQEIISYNSRISNSLKKKKISKDNTGKISEKFLKTATTDKILSKQVVIPSSVDMNSTKKLSKIKAPVKEVESISYNNDTQMQYKSDGGYNSNDKMSTSETEIKLDPIQIPGSTGVEKTLNSTEKPETIEEKKRRGRPRKVPSDAPTEINAEQVKRKRGRPRKNSFEQESDNVVLPGIETKNNDVTLPGLEAENDNVTLPGLEVENDSATLPGSETENDNVTLPGLETENNNATIGEIQKSYEQEETFMPEINNTEINDNISINPRQSTKFNTFEEPVSTNETLQYSNFSNVTSRNYSYEDIDITNLLTPDKRVACFVGTTKNGTSFIVNNLAQITSQMGINTAILDTTKNRNSYYIYTQNDENLRKVAMSSISNLLQGVASGIEVNKLLTVYTSLPEETEGLENAGAILQTLLKKHSLILIDCDFMTPIDYFKKTQELFLVQSLDILTIQPLTAFLRELKSKNILKQEKLRIVLNKAVNLRGVNDKVIIGGMAYYNDPSMSFMTELFDKQIIKYISIPFDEEVYVRYLENIVNCEVSTKGYPKHIIQCFNELAEMTYPVNSGSLSYVPPSVQRNTFTPEMNSTLDQMKKKY